MAAFHLVRDHLHAWDPALTRVAVPADRLAIEKRRWRGIAEDGTEFGFDLDHPLAHRDVVFADERAFYQLEQRPEAVIAITLGSAAEAARVGWMIGNLHFKIAVAADEILTPDDSAIRQMLSREGILTHASVAVFQPLLGAHSHEHG